MPFLTAYTPQILQALNMLPLADQVITTLIYEMYLYDSISKKKKIRTY